MNNNTVNLIRAEKRKFVATVLADYRARRISSGERDRLLRGCGMPIGTEKRKNNSQSV